MIGHMRGPLVDGVRMNIKTVNEWIRKGWFRTVTAGMGGVARLDGLKVWPDDSFPDGKFEMVDENGYRLSTAEIAFQGQFATMRRNRQN